MSTIPRIDQDTVDQALNTAVDDGYPYGKLLSTMPMLEIAADLIRRDTNFVNAVPEDLLPYVEVWFRRFRRRSLG